ncbi:DUF4407 domain-containing protein [Chryseosolibacter indicus]|uniref:DUF4407 domain-containing protein n=1 Tax=Chryseosolibacter indicus TaxID=2782351 RepID=A0ABS5VLZ2_9BACT|nr:DUF4407 domain-containing protein [Chryseosolibacter indicus]MBT1701734.1 DUF4407 domain-containing protein [Chryseosolibacter indicus]
MQKLTSFFWFCSGAEVSLLKKCPTETSKYVSIGATVFFTGLFAALAAGYSLYTVFDNALTAIFFGMLWGLMIFNLDRYIVSSLRKAGRAGKELLMATPRIVLAVLISIVIAKPLELKIFEKEINPELVLMEQEKFAQQEGQINLKYEPSQDSLKNEITILKGEIEKQTLKRDELARIAQEEADGTGGSRKRNLGPIYKVKKADADKAEQELRLLSEQNNQLIAQLQRQIEKNSELMQKEIASLDRSRINGPAARMEALNRITKESSAIWLAHWFIMLLFIALETSPVFVKLVSSRGPYDNLLKMEEHGFYANEVEFLAKTNSEVKERSSNLGSTEAEFVNDRLNQILSK